jgi:hypothetical protein
MCPGRTLGQADLQTKNLTNQEIKTILQGNQAVVAAQHDPSWDPSDPDKIVKVLRQYNVPLPLQGQVVEGLGKMKTSMMNGSKEDLAALAEAHADFDDQFQSLKTVPDDNKQKAYQQVLANQRNFAARLPSSVRNQAMQEIDKAPPLYNENYIRTEHAMLRTTQFLTEDALKQAQTREALGKGSQAQQEGNLFAARIPGAVAEGQLTQAKIPGAEAESDIQQQQAAMNPQQRALAGNLFYGAAGGNAQEKRALNLETQQKVAAAQATVANVPAGLKGVAPHLVAPAAADATKYGQEYADAVAAANDMKTFVDMAKGGNKIAYAYSPTEGVLTLNTARGVKRVNMAEISSYGGAGSALDRIKGFLGKQTSGASIPDSVLNDMQSLHQAIAGNAQTTYANKLKNVNSTYGSHFEPVNMGGPPAGATGKVKGSDGKFHWTDGKGDLGVAE